MRFRQLLPEPREVDVRSLLEALGPEDPPPPDRPYTLVNFVSSADGRAAIDGRSGPLSDDGDRAMFHGLREWADAVMAGTNTLRTERYGRIIGRPERRERRASAGRDPEPLACMVSRSGELPLEIPLFDEPEARVVVFGPDRIDPSIFRAATAQVTLHALPSDQLTLTGVMRRLRDEHGVRTLLCEGGPILFGALLRDRLVDELFLTVVPQLAGGGAGPTISQGLGLDDPQPLRLAWLLERNGSLFARYRMR
ncbi:MAG: dihydrofolate reductase family protein [Solirubrobacteraceae bacterium]